MIIGAYEDGQTAYGQALNDVRFFLVAAATAALSPNEKHHTKHASLAATTS
ncbi:MAG: hypothetical protein L0H03_17870 [Rhodococcus sp. (in: high G+C Gram-positive bacteria)]|nr:hypothetical protein [Rhodococcus sp. (in: high G+C Gram-positive bacteria)]